MPFRQKNGGFGFHEWIVLDSDLPFGVRACNNQSLVVLNCTVKTELGLDLQSETAIGLGSFGTVPVLAMAGQSAAAALRTVSTKGGRQMKMMLDQGELVKIGRTSELLDVVGKYGDSAMSFVWQNKGALLVGTALAAFLSDPEPFINGTKELATVAANVALEPIAREIGARTNWTVTICGLAIVSVTYLAFKQWLRRSRK